MPAIFRVVLDANVLFPFSLRDTLLRAADAGYYQLYWSEEILAEAQRNLVARGHITEDQAERLFTTMRDAFPEAMVVDHEPLIDDQRPIGAGVEHHFGVLDGRPCVISRRRHEVNVVFEHPVDLPPFEARHPPQFLRPLERPYGTRNRGSMSSGISASSASVRRA